jgi:hypothetical protein
MTAAEYPRGRGGNGCALVLAPALFVSLWLEVSGGTGETWNNLQTGQFDLWAALFHVLFAFAGPIAVVVTTLRCRSNREHVVRRIVHIEKWGLAVSCPFAIIGFLAMAAAAII